METKETIEKLVEILRNDNDYMERRIAAAEALSNTSWRIGREALVAIIDDTLEDLTLQAAAIKALGASLNLN